MSLAASAPIVTYGGPVTLTGKVSSGKANEQVIVYGKPYGEVSYVQLATVLTADGGLWSYSTTPALLTSYQAQWNSLKSAEIQTAVEPKLTLKRIGAWFVARVDAAPDKGRDLAGDAVVHGCILSTVVYSIAAAERARSRSWNFWILPVEVFGSASKRTSRGTL